MIHAPEPAPEPQMGAAERPGESAGRAEPVGESSCPFCLKPTAQGATKCGECGANIGDTQLCSACREPVRASATLCPFCGTDLRPPSQSATELEAEPWVVYASPLGAMVSEMSATALLFPPILTITPAEIHVRRRALFGLRTLDTKLAVSRVASVRAIKGVFWSSIIVETYGGASGDLSIAGLDKAEARETATLIERITRAATGGRRADP